MISRELLQRRRTPADACRRLHSNVMQHGSGGLSELGKAAGLRCQRACNGLGLATLRHCGEHSERLRTRKDDRSPVELLLLGAEFSLL